MRKEKKKKKKMYLKSKQKNVYNKIFNKIFIFIGGSFKKIESGILKTDLIAQHFSFLWLPT